MGTIKATDLAISSAVSVGGTSTLIGAVSAAGAVTLGSTVSIAGAVTTGSSITLSDNELVRPVLKDYGEKVNAIGSIGGGGQDLSGYDLNGYMDEILVESGNASRIYTSNFTPSTTQWT